MKPQMLNRTKSAMEAQLAAYDEQLETAHQETEQLRAQLRKMASVSQQHAAAFRVQVEEEMTEPPRVVLSAATVCQWPSAAPPT